MLWTPSLGIKGMKALGSLVKSGGMEKGRVRIRLCLFSEALWVGRVVPELILGHTCPGWVLMEPRLAG